MLNIPSPDMATAVTRLLSSIPGLKHTAMLVNGDRVELQFDHTCQGLLERSWPDVYRLGLDCGCRAHMECEDILTTRTVFDTESAAPVMETVTGGKVVLTISRQGVEKEVAA